MKKKLISSLLVLSLVIVPIYRVSAHKVDIKAVEQTKATYRKLEFERPIKSRSVYLTKSHKKPIKQTKKQKFLDFIARNSKKIIALEAIIITIEIAFFFKVIQEIKEINLYNFIGENSLKEETPNLTPIEI